MNRRSRIPFFPLCDLHHCPMRHVMLEASATEENQSLHQCERRDCHRIFRDAHGYLDFVDGRFDASRLSSRKCPKCRGLLYLSEVNHALKVETWECAQIACNFSQDIPSPSTR